MNNKTTWQIHIRRAFAQGSITGPLAILILVYVLFSFLIPNFSTFRSLSGIINAATLTGVVTIGVTMLMISGEFDLSVGALVAMGGYLYGMNANAGRPELGALLAVLIPALMGSINGFIRIWTNIPSFIVTLGTRSIFRGAVWVVSGGALLQTVEKLPIYNFFNGRMDAFNQLFEGANFRTSLIWIAGILLICQYALTRTKFGNHVFAVGGNTGAALAQGVDVKRIKVINFIISGALAGFTGVLLFSQYTSVRVASGDGMELNAIAAAVVGGTLLSGGYGSIWGALVGVLTISVLRTGVVLLNIPFIPADNFEAVVGVTIILAVILNNWLRERA